MHLEKHTKYEADLQWGCQGSITEKNVIEERIAFGMCIAKNILNFKIPQQHFTKIDKSIANKIQYGPND
jgi:hypothetical protein